MLNVTQHLVYSFNRLAIGIHAIPGISNFRALSIFDHANFSSQRHLLL